MNTYDDNGVGDNDHDDSDNDNDDFSCVNNLTFQLCFTFHKYIIYIF